MYPEAGYSFDGKKTPLPDSLGRFVKKLGIPVVTIITDGAFLRDPLYNELNKRKAKTSATVKLAITKNDIAEKTLVQIGDKHADKVAPAGHKGAGGGIGNISHAPGGFNNLFPGIGRKAAHIVEAVGNSPGRKPQFRSDILQSYLLFSRTHALSFPLVQR